VATMVAGFVVGKTIVRIVRFRETLISISLGIGMSLLGWLACTCTSSTGGICVWDGLSAWSDVARSRRACSPWPRPALCRLSRGVMRGSP
jgi:hypothetical protein